MFFIMQTEFSYSLRNNNNYNDNKTKQKNTFYKVIVALSQL